MVTRTATDQPIRDILKTFLLVKLKLHRVYAISVGTASEIPRRSVRDHDIDWNVGTSLEQILDWPGPEV